MASMSKFTENQIMKRRNQEIEISKMESKLKAEFLTQTNAAWENKGQDVQRRKFIKS